jgi:hypothetical protein
MSQKRKGAFTLEYSYFQNALFTILYAPLILILLYFRYKSCMDNITARAVRLWPLTAESRVQFLVTIFETRSGSITRTGVSLSFFDFPLLITIPQFSILNYHLPLHIAKVLWDKRWREECVNSKWLNINEDLAYRKIISCTNVSKIKSVGKYLFKTKWENKVRGGHNPP